MRALAGIVLALAFASQASAATVARTTPEAGPVLAGPEVLWGSEGSDGTVRVMAGAPGRPPRLVHRVAAPTGEETTRGIGPLAASPEAFAVRVPTSTLFERDFDSVGYVGEDALLAGPLGGGATLLFGALPERVDDRPCEGRYEALAGVAVDGDRIAVGSESGRPGVRLLDRHASSNLALAGGRVLYERTLDDSYRRTTLELRPLAEGPRRTLARLGARRALAGPLDLDATRATWAVERGERAPGRIVLRKL